MRLKQLADRAKQAIDERGGTERLKHDAERLRNIATGPGTPKEKAKAAGEALRQRDATPEDPATPPAADAGQPEPPTTPPPAPPA